MQINTRLVTTIHTYQSDVTPPERVRLAPFDTVLVSMVAISVSSSRSEPTVLLTYKRRADQVVHQTRQLFATDARPEWIQRLVDEAVYDAASK